MTDRQRNGFILLLVIGLILGSLVVIAGIPGGAVKPKKTVLGLDLKGGVELVYQGQPSAQTPKVTPDALQRAVDIMRSRVDQLGVAEPEIQTTGGNQITVGLRRGPFSMWFSEDFTPGAWGGPTATWFYDSNAPDVVFGVSVQHPL